jgi:preprotein translocase subunit SecA
MKKFLKRALGDPQAKTLKRYKKRVVQINALEDKYKKMSDKELAAQTAILKDRIKNEKKNPLDGVLNDAFALVREAASRTIGQRHFDVQLIGGMTLHEGKIAEMKTGEGKTLVATLPLYLNALEGKGAHLVTVNDYLAQLHAGWMGEIYNFLGLSCAVIMADLSYIFDPTFDNKDHDDPRFRHLMPCTRQEAYAADITYGTNNEFGFDYLRDNMVREVDQLRQRDLNYAIVDEVDSILIDEARTPLIISAPATTSGSSYAQFAKIIRQLKRDKHYEVDEKRKETALTDEGIDQVEKALGIKNLYGTDNIRNIYHLNQALKAQALFKRDKDYVVTNDGEVVIVDEFTGRLLKGRRYNEGLHQAIEAKEGVEVQEESMTLATISFQNYFRLYNKLAGMTGTAETEAEEFHQIYKLDVVQIPPNRKVVRDDRADKIYKTEMGKFNAIIEEVKVLHAEGRPVLIGTVSIEKNEVLSRLLKKAGVPHQVLNAKNNESEAKIIMQAGQKGAVTLATNIAGRGTDIMLGEGVKEVGGLAVIGSERHESRRIDNQLRGRGGRQGDPGTSQFFVSTEDDLMRIFGGEKIQAVMGRLKIDDSMPLQNRFVSKSLEGAQKKVEGFNFDTRKNVVQYDDVMNRHRKATYIMRKQILHEADIHGRIKVFINDEARQLSRSPESITDNFEPMVKEVFPLSEKTLDKLFDSDTHKFEKSLEEAALKQYSTQETRFGAEVLRKVERDVYLQILDNLWMQHLENMEHLREGIGWVGIGQRDPLVEYRRQAQHLFETMQQDLRHDTLRTLFHAEPIEEDALDRPVETELTRAARSSVEGSDVVVEIEDNYSEEDFLGSDKAKHAATRPSLSHKKKQQSRKKERKNKAKNRRRK